MRESQAMEIQTRAAALGSVIVAGLGPPAVLGAHSILRSLSFGTFASVGNFCTVNSFHKRFILRKENSLVRSYSGTEIAT